ncbi:hypothetical protein [Algoriphagus sp.]|uniref:hypothetical protein n=1 Tax=Algoriphagus sp. TaxID=1872435 RepID=UPI003F70C0FB
MNYRLLRIIPLIFSMGFLLSCGNDDTDPITSTDLEGSWNLQSMDYVGTQTITQDGELFSKENITGTGTDVDMIFNFIQDKVNVKEVIKWLYTMNRFRICL